MPMDAVGKRSYELQAQVRHNAEEYRNTLNDLYSWQKEMKDKEQEMQKHTTTDEQSLKTLPVRSHIIAEQQSNIKEDEKPTTPAVAMDKKSLPSGSKANATTPTEKTETPLEQNEEKRRQANEIKNRGNNFVKLGEYEKALYEYTGAIDVFAEDPIFYTNRALCYLKLERYNECIEDCDRAIEIDKLAVKAYYRRMQANECLGNNLDALKDCTSALMIEPKNIEANKSLERINERLRKHVRAGRGPNFTALRENMVDILPIEKPPYKRSNKPLRRIPVADIIGPSNNGDNLKISDEDIDKLFNSNCGPFVEVKTGSDITKADPVNPKTESSESIIKKDTNITHADKSNLISNPTPEIKEAKPAERISAGQKDFTEKNKADQKVNKNTTQRSTVAKAIKTPTASTSNQRSESSVAEIDETTSERPLPPAPTSTAQFYSNWKELSPIQKYHYLKSIDVKQLCKILGAGFDSDTLTDVLRILHDYYLPHNEGATPATLLEISKNNQLKILSLMMSTEEQKVLSEILDVIKENGANTSTAEQIKNNFNLH